MSVIEVRGEDGLVLDVGEDDMAILCFSTDLRAAEYERIRDAWKWARTTGEPLVVTHAQVVVLRGGRKQRAS